MVNPNGSDLIPAGERPDYPGKRGEACQENLMFAKNGIKPGRAPQTNATDREKGAIKWQD